jgi:transglutaminase-like putative cysteine protease
VSDPLAFIVTAACYLAMLRLGTARGQGRLSVAIAAVAVVAALLVPSMLPAVAPESTGGGRSVSTGVNPVLTLGEDLRASQERTVLEYSTESRSGEYLRLTTVDDFEGAAWEPTRAAPTSANTLDSIPFPVGLAEGVPVVRESSDIRILSLDSPWLPVPYPPTAVSGVDDSWRWSRGNLSISSRTNGSAGEEYRVASLSPDPTPEQLTEAGASTPSSASRFLQLPAGLAPSVTLAALDAVGESETAYQRAVALQDYFRYGDFDYSETAPVDEGYDGTGAGVVATFLEERSGYCIHFASAMAVMARTVGIPSRIAVGFLPGDRVTREGESAFEVTNRDLHAWPELYFEGLGWLRFEPTVSRGDVPGYAEPGAADAPSLPGEESPTPTASAAPGASPTAAPGAAPDDAGSDAEAGNGDLPAWIWPVIAVLVLLLAAAIPALTRRVQRLARRGRLRRGAAPPTLAWRELLQTAEDLRIQVPQTLTPAEVPGLLLPGGTHESLGRLVAAVERESYSREGLTAEPGIVSDLDATIAALRRAASPRTRVVADLVPPSIWSRLPLIGR